VEKMWRIGGEEWRENEVESREIQNNTTTSQSQKAGPQQYVYAYYETGNNWPKKFPAKNICWY